MVQKVPVGKHGLFALVDDEDFALVSQYRWHVIHGGYAAHSYRHRGKYHALLMHRLILGLDSGDPQVDHINHSGLDNCRANLRLATQAQNNANARKQNNTSSRFKGVSWANRRQRWSARIRVHSKHIWLGYFDDETDAARAYDAAAACLFGAFAALNFLDATPAPYIPRPKSVRGVFYCPSYHGLKKWCAQIQHNGSRYQRHFLTEQEATAALQAYNREDSL